MPSHTELPPDDLKLARESATALIDHKAYLPPGGLLLMLLSRFRDDIGEILGGETDAGPSPRRSQGESGSTAPLTS